MTTRQDFIGNRIRLLREDRGLARLAVQRLTGVSEATIARAERGGIVTRRTAERLAAALDVKPEDLMPGGEKTQQQPPRPLPRGEGAP